MMKSMNISRYGTTIFAANAREALALTGREVLTMGTVVKPRGMLTRELRHCTVIVEDPTDWACDGINANWSPVVAAVEAVQLIGGFSDPPWVLERVASLRPFMNEEGAFDGAYGPRSGGVLEAVVARLQDDVDTRQAIIPMYDFRDATRKNSKDYPCTLSLHFLIRGGRLDLDVTMRSNDVDWGLKHDMSQFMLLQCSVANLLELPAGRYAHTSNSMHIYERSFDWADNLVASPARSRLSPPCGGITSDNGTARGLQDRAIAIAYNGRRKLAFENPVEGWLVEVLHP